MADGQKTSYELSGDALYVDGHIVTWHPLANVPGLHTAYRLDRVAGRYESIDDERTRPRTVHPLANDQPLDIFRLSRKYALLAPIVDAEYGSATFVSSREPRASRFACRRAGCSPAACPATSAPLASGSPRESSARSRTMLP